MQQHPSSALTSRRLATPKYCLHARSGRAYVTIAGRQVYLGEYGSPESRDEYDRVIAEWLTAGRPRDEPLGSRGVSVNELILAYLRHAVDYYRKPSGERTSEYDQMRNAVRELKRLYGLTNTDAFQPAHLKAVRDSLVAAGLTRNGVNRRISRILRVFKWGVGEGLVDPMTHHALAQVSSLRRGRSEAPETDPVRPVVDKHIDAITKHVSRQVWAMVQLQRLTGMRPGEVCKMQTAEIDCSQPVWIYSPSDHKTAHHGHRRIVPLGPKAQAVLAGWLKDDPDRFLFSPAEAERERRLTQRAARKTKVQPSQMKYHKRKAKRRPKDCYSVQSYCRAIHRGCVKAGVPGWAPNQLRHTAATEIRSRHGIEIASILLGHKGLDVTQVYAERDEKRAIDVVGEFG